MLFNNLHKERPFELFHDYYARAEEHGDKFAEAGCISSVDQANQPHSRFVNFKYFFEDNLIFFSNYESHKAQQFEVNNKVSVNFWWPNLEVQVRIEGIISKCEEKFSDEHFQGREPGKNIAAIISEQSKGIESYELLKDKYQAMKEKVENGEYAESRPEKWGGYQIKVNFFEFWEANDDRLNYRECYRRDGDSWSKFFLQS
jgi:pyridoxamine 5'-phosphate oxidase